MIDRIAYVLLVITITGLPLGTWAHMRLPRWRPRGDRQLLTLIRHTRKARR